MLSWFLVFPGQRWVAGWQLLVLRCRALLVVALSTPGLGLMGTVLHNLYGLWETLVASPWGCKVQNHVLLLLGQKAPVFPHD